MFCNKCGTENVENAAFCTKCGTDISIQTPPERKHTSSSETLSDSDTMLNPEIEVDSFKTGSLFANRYEIESEGRKGGMGTVYKCKDTKLNEIVALKVIHPKLLSSQQATSRFGQEVALSRKLQHNNIVRVYNLEEWQGKEYFSMEWVEGVTLRDALNRRKKDGKPLNLVEAGNIISQLSDALHYAHTYTVHRDISPENILIESESSDDISDVLSKAKIKLTDFGIAKMLFRPGFTNESMQMGKPYYMAPEQKTDAGAVDKRADIYATGVVLFELLTLENTIGLKLPTEINDELPKEIDYVIKNALEPKPIDRYEDVKELSEALNRVVRVESDNVGEESIKGKGAERRGREEKKKEAIERKENIDSLLEKGRSYMSQMDYHRAIKMFEDVLKIDSRNKKAEAITQG